MRRPRPAPTRTTDVRSGRASRRVTALVLGVGLFAAPLSAQGVTESVFRFYNRQTGTYF